MSRLLLIGCGNMAGAILKGWAAHPIYKEFSRVDVVKPSPPSADIALPGVSFHTSINAIGATPDFILLGVKPHQLAAVIAQATEKFGSKPIYISIAAGKTLGVLSSYASDRVKPDSINLVRAMPNTPVGIGQGITGLCTPDYVSEACRQLVQRLFAALGVVTWIKEEQMNALTALCGSGPAYVFYYMECLAMAAMNLGLNARQADMLSRQMVLGAAALASKSDASLQHLRQNVTSPNGTTAAALEVWMQPKTLDQQASKALAAAVHRAQALEAE